LFVTGLLCKRSVITKWNKRCIAWLLFLFNFNFCGLLLLLL
jgi:hypothetical protein